jgi:hypothetical protein
MRLVWKLSWVLLGERRQLRHPKDLLRLFRRLFVLLSLQQYQEQTLLLLALRQHQKQVVMPFQIQRFLFARSYQLTA